jgi:hypothetical protein
VQALRSRGRRTPPRWTPLRSHHRLPRCRTAPTLLNVRDDLKHEVSAGFYEGVGRVAVAAGKLDLILAQLVTQLRSQELPESGGSRDWVTILSGKSGTPRKHFKQVVSQLAARPSSAALLSLHLDVEDAFDERDRLIHSFNMTTVHEAGNPDRATLHAHSNTEIALPTYEELRILDERLQSLAHRALMMLLEYLTPAPSSGQLVRMRTSSS